MRKWGYLAHLIAALAGGLGGYATLLAAHQTMSYPGDVIWAILFFLGAETAFAVAWRLRAAPHSRATPAAIYALALTAAAIPCGVIGFRGALLGVTLVGGDNQGPLLIPFLAEVSGFLLGFGVPMTPTCWLLWRYLGRRG